MSLEFNRRSFLKYSAAAAVAVAGSSLLVGCGEDEYQKTGKIGSTLKLMVPSRPIRLLMQLLVSMPPPIMPLPPMRASSVPSTSSVPPKRFLCM